MAEITPAQRLGDDDEEMIVALWDQVLHDAGADEVDQGLAADLLALRSRVAALLLQQLQDTALPLSPESWRWVDGVEETALGAAEMLAGQAAEIHRALSPRRWPADDAEAEAAAFLAALRRQAEYTAARQTDAEDVAALTHLIREKEMQRMAERGLLHPDVAALLDTGETTGASEEEEGLMQMLAVAEYLVHPAAAALLGYVAGKTDALLARVPAEELALAPQVKDMAVRVEASMAALAGRLRRGAAEFAARPGEEAFAAALHRQAASADATRATVETFTASVRRFRAAAAGSAMPPAATGCSLRPKL
ncbi:unnamed protein product [Urochloa decumbens]|uniref:Uncharacterized protein n=1 Tax=Urochloa decumbens TaxID=240449 RepID=A0ABC8VHM6_9POAL